jgi:hypothetical protein
VISNDAAVSRPEEECDMLAYLEDPELMLQENVIVVHNHGDVTSCPF